MEQGEFVRALTETSSEISQVNNNDSLPLLSAKDHHKLCSDHFVKGKPASEMHQHTCEWVPPLHMGHSGCKKTTQRGPRLEQTVQRLLKKKMMQPSSVTLSTKIDGNDLTESNDTCRTCGRTEEMAVNKRCREAAHSLTTFPTTNNPSVQGRCEQLCVAPAAIESHPRNPSIYNAHTHWEGLQDFPSENHRPEMSCNHGSDMCNHGDETDDKKSDGGFVNCERDCIQSTTLDTKDKMSPDFEANCLQEDKGLKPDIGTVYEAISSQANASGIRKEADIVCKVCMKVFSCGFSLKVHKRIHTGEKPHVCKVCKKAFSQNSHLRTHERIHSREKPYICQVCKKAFGDCSSLRRHEQIHSADKPYVCKICKKAFNQHSYLKIHEKIHGAEKPHVCKICNKAFRRHNHLTSHERIHSNEKPYICQTCKKAFSDCSTLKRHERIHTGEKSIICRICEKAFNQHSHLKIHEHLHTGERPFVCKICKTAFSLRSTLRTHEFIHTGEKPYICKTCKKAFSQPGYLRRHERIHTGEKPYICKICNKAFNRLSNLKTHKRTHTKDKPYVCKICAKSFGYFSSLRRHEQMHTGENLYVC